MFIHLNIETLTQVINRELERQLDAQKVFENEPVVNGFHSPTNTHFQEVNLFQEITTQSHQTQEQTLQTDNFLPSQISTLLPGDFQPLSEQQQNNVEPKQKFQISAQQLQQLQQQIELIEDPGQHFLESSPLVQQPLLLDSEFSQKLQLSPKHLQQLQYEIELLEDPGFIQRKSQQLRLENQEIEEIEEIEESYHQAQTFKNIQQQTDSQQSFYKSLEPFEQQSNEFLLIEHKTETSEIPQKQIFTEPLQQSQQAENYLQQNEPQ